ncbi:MAG: hypothetical protein WAU01_01120 [Saprospiraceae bacterium]
MEISKLITLILLLGCQIMFNGCASLKINNASIYNRKSGRPNIAVEKEVAFSLKSKQPFTMDKNIYGDDESNIGMKIFSIMDAQSVLMNLDEKIPAGNYNVRASTSIVEFKVVENLALYVVINGLKKRINPKVSATVTMK